MLPGGRAPELPLSYVTREVVARSAVHGRAMRTENASGARGRKCTNKKNIRLVAAAALDEGSLWRRRTECSEAPARSRIKPAGKDQRLCRVTDQ